MSQSQRTSFRDPGGRVVRAGDRVLRLLNESGAAEFEAFAASACAKKLAGEGKLVGARRLDAAPAGLAESPPAMCLEHDAIWFPSYPGEWPPEMLHAAGVLTLDLMEQSLGEGFGLKDATPHNVLFNGPAPVFVDWLSFEKRDALDPLWLAQAQFARTFLLPLLAWKRLGLPPHEALLVHRDGIEPAQLYKMLGWWGRVRPPALGLVSMPTWLSGKAEQEGEQLYSPRRENDPKKARFILDFALRGLKKKLTRVAPQAARDSVWSGYMETRPGHYEAETFAAKEAFVGDALKSVGPAHVLDVGCNTGHFSEIAAKAGAQVVGIDLDPVVVGMTWRRASGKSLNIQPLVVNLAQPTPALGWRNAECASFLERAAGRFELVLMLAVVHHMLVSERVPLEEIVDVVAELSTDAVVIEYVDPADPMFRRIVRGRENLHAGLTPERFEAAWKARFEVARSEKIGQTRALYLMRRRSN
ncbi:MAG: class I SAM-dependent methyltransferase [Chrysiogenetes bacterium]|nr:class I SAM-dependent methyltransferase [Chrysiogenetes bacterium]